MPELLAPVKEELRPEPKARHSVQNFGMIMTMKEISIQDLKAGLSAAISEAESGDTIVITRHREPVAKLVPAFPRYDHRGKDMGKGGLKPALKRGKKIAYLHVLLEDRGDR